jgi:hypothetical protein
MWGPQLERLLRASSLAFLDTPGTSMVDILRLYFDPAVRAGVLDRCQNPVALVFFKREFTQKFTYGLRGAMVSWRLRARALRPYLQRARKTLGLLMGCGPPRAEERS